MYTNERFPSIKHQSYQAMIRRLPKSHPSYQRLLNKKSIEDSGLHGEMYFDQVASKLLSPTCLHLKNSLLTLFKETFQVDSIIITPYFILISEIKNMVGNLIFDKKGGSLTRMLNGQKEYFTCPLFQVSRHTECVEYLLNQLNISVPVIDQVIYTNQYVEFTVKDSEIDIYEKILRIEQFTYHYRKIIKNYPHKHLTETQIKFIYQTLLQRNVLPFWNNHLTLLGISRDEIIKGFICLECNNIAETAYGGWRCHTCRKRVDHMFYQNMIDYFLLSGYTAKSSDLKDFLAMSSNRQVLTYINKIDIQSEMVGRQRIFFSPIHAKSTFE
ncbi:nuclease-related domain-containing protein [Jeotgalibacillus salarius]|uniref:NERD domain-containing protein n=1 Tax=Jeotgalibacillus salarius TaxID=546023 RepID=A0A4Y8LLS5_9BACL|nr:nuclease-related domain-containing protein [Jeotgalibacillus salarius]TFE03906.1 NERD domain-containing protein [Jeotgalibacillus salarius]